MSIPNIELGTDKKRYSDLAYSKVWKAYTFAREKSSLPTIYDTWWLVTKAFQDPGTAARLKAGGLEDRDDMVKALKHLGVSYRKNDHRLIKRRQRPQRHTRKLRSGKKVLINKTILRRKIFPTIAPRPMLAQADPQGVRSQAGWGTERKFDGFRAIAIKRGDKVRIYSRNGKEYTKNFPEIAREISYFRELAVILDGEIVYLDKQGNDQFRQVQMRTQIKDPTQRDEYIRRYPVNYFIFDILEYEEDGKFVQQLPWMERKHLLQKMFSSKKFDYVKLTDTAITHQGREALRKEQHDLEREGVIHKRVSAPYQEDTRSPDWRKDKFSNTADLCIIGYEKGTGRLTGQLGAVYTAAWNQNGLVYTGKVGTGFDDIERPHIQKALDTNKLPHYQGHYSFKNIPSLHTHLNSPELNSAVWIWPPKVAEIKYFELSKDNRLRHGVFLRMRTDKKPTECLLKEVKP
jgi:bifunctional non-homologous end joining protein LigD